MEKKLYRSENDKKIAGVCGGLAKFLKIDATVIRVIWAVLAIGSVGTFVLAYLVCALLIPEEPTITVE